MRPRLGILLILALVPAANANEMHRVPVTVRTINDGNQIRVEAVGEFRESHITLTIVADTAKSRIRSISGTLDGAAFKVNVRAFRRATEVQFQELALTTDCCAYGYSVNWQMPFGVAKQCFVDTPEGRKQQLVNPVIYITVDRGGAVRRAHVIDC